MDFTTAMVIVLCALIACVTVIACVNTIFEKERRDKDGP